MKLSRRQLRNLILEELGPDRMEKPDIDMSDEDISIADDENKFDLELLGNLLAIAKMEKEGAPTPKINFSENKLYLDYGKGVFVEVMIKKIGNRKEINTDDLKDLEGRIGVY